MKTALFIQSERRLDLAVDLDSSVGGLSNDQVKRLVEDSMQDPYAQLGKVPPAAPVVYVIAGIVLYGAKEKLDKERKDTKDTKESKDAKETKDTKDQKDSQDQKNSKDNKDTKDSTDQKTTKDQKDAADGKSMSVETPQPVTPVGTSNTNSGATSIELAWGEALAAEQASRFAKLLAKAGAF